MYQKFDDALKKAISSANTPFGIRERGLLIATARRASTDNRVKALNEATLGEFHFAKIHETASIRYHEDAEALANDELPKHQSISHYFSIAQAYKIDDRERTRATENWRKNVA